jgi:hypothetical protein
MSKELLQHNQQLRSLPQGVAAENVVEELLLIQNIAEFGILFVLNILKKGDFIHVGLSCYAAKAFELNFI